MGSFSSKMRLSASGNNDNDRKPSKSGVNRGGTPENANSPTRADATSVEDDSKVGNTSQEQPSETKVVQSFGWLVQTPVVPHTTAKELKRQAKSGPEGKSKARNVMKYSNGKYLKSAELVSTSATDTIANPKQGDNKQAHAGPSSSSSYRKYTRNGGKGYEGGKGRAKQNAGQMNKDDVSANPRPGGAYPVGFGAIPEKRSQLP